MYTVSLFKALNWSLNKKEFEHTFFAFKEPKTGKIDD